MMSPWFRKLALTLHSAVSLGWLGAVLVSLVLAICAFISDDASTVKAAYLSLNLIGWNVLVPLSAASLLSGIIQALGTHWGLFRHFWVVVKLVINLFATGILLLYMKTLGVLAKDAASNTDVFSTRSASPVLHSGGALLLLIAATTLSIYKPRGLTRYGWRKQFESPGVPE